MLNIREANLSDLESIFYIMKSNDILKNIFGDLSKKEILDKIKQRLTDKKWKIFVAIKDNKVIGYTCFCSLKDYAEERFLPEGINSKRYVISCGLAVYSKYHRQGIASELKKYVFEKVSKEYKGIYAAVLENNFISIKLQNSLGLVMKQKYVCPSGKNYCLFLKEF